MTKLKYNYKGFMKKAFSYICRALSENKTLNQAGQDLRRIVNSYEGLNRNERYQLYLACYNLYRAGKHRVKSEDWQEYISLRRSYDSVLKIARRVQKNLDLRKKRQETKELLDSHLNETIFFACSKHNSPAEDHAPFQGLIYVDRFWRGKVRSYMYRAVEAYIRNHQIISVQEIMGAPVYLTTRPYCKHYFIPLNTYEVLHTSVKRLIEQYAIHRTKKYTVQDYFDLRSTVYQMCDKISPHEQFKKKQKKA